MLVPQKYGIKVHAILLCLRVVLTVSDVTSRKGEFEVLAKGVSIVRLVMS